MGPSKVCKLCLACGHLHDIARNGLPHPHPLKSDGGMSQGRMKQVLSQKTRVHPGKQFRITLRHEVLGREEPGKVDD